MKHQMTDSLKTVRTRKASTPEVTKSVTVKAAKGQKKNAAGGFVFKADDESRLRRFLILGSEANFYTSGEKLTKQNAELVEKFASTAESSKALVDLIVEVSTEGRAPKVNPAIFALAIAASHGDTESKSYALAQLPAVLRTGTHLFLFAEYVEQFRGWGRGLKRAVANWYTEKDVDKLAYQAVKYQAREGWSHRDLFRLSHPETTSPALQGLGDWILRGDSTLAPKIVEGFVKAHAADTKDIPALVREYGLSWEMLPTESLNEKATWEALLDGNVPLGALLRQLPRLTRIGVLKDMDPLTVTVAARLTDQAELVRARIHPLNILIAQKTYSDGRSVRGSSTWTPVQLIADALDKAFYLAFKAVDPANKRTMIGVDVSGSMSSRFSDLPISSAEVAGAMALVTMATEPMTAVYGFSHVISKLPITPSMRLDDAMRKVQDRNFGSTDASLLIREATKNNIEVDTFVVITDNDTWMGNHVFQELERYRAKTGIPAKMIVLATYASKFTVADPNDPNSLDLAGFDSATPAMIANFSRGF